MCVRNGPGFFVADCYQMGIGATGADDNGNRCGKVSDKLQERRENMVWE